MNEHSLRLARNVAASAEKKKKRCARARKGVVHAPALGCVRGRLCSYVCVCSRSPHRLERVRTPASFRVCARDSSRALLACALIGISARACALGCTFTCICGHANARLYICTGMRNGCFWYRLNKLRACTRNAGVNTFVYA